MPRAGDMRWLVVDTPVEQLWPRVREFLTEQGLEIKSEQAKLGILDTHWAENRADIPQNVIRGIISKVAPKLYGAPTRDRYRLRLERGELATATEIYLSHYGLEQLNHGDGVVWQPRPSDPELVSEMLSRLMLTLGVSKARAQSVLMEKGNQTAPAQFDGDALLVAEGFPRAWRLVGIALDRVGLVVEENDRSQGIYVTRQTEAFKLPGPPEEKGFFDLFGSKPEQERRFRLRVEGNDSSSRVTVVDEKGGALPPDIAKAILTRVQEQLH
jgi:outer membrane protein assembly factor BamC